MIFRFSERNEFSVYKFLEFARGDKLYMMWVVGWRCKFKYTLTFSYISLIENGKIEVCVNTGN